MHRSSDPTTSVQPAFAGWSGRPLRASLVLLLVLAVVLAYVAVALVAAAQPALVVPLAAFAAIGVADVGLGVLAWDRRPHNRTGLLLCVTGLLIVLAVAGNAEPWSLRAAGFLAGQAPIAALLHVLLAYPSGRLGSVPARALAAGGYLVTVGGDAVQLVRLATGSLDPDQRPPADDVVRLAQRSLGAAVLLAAGVLLLARLRAAKARGRPAGERWAVGAVYAWGVGMLAFFPLSANVFAPLLGWSPLVLFVAQLVPLLLMPAVFATGLLRGGFARTGRLEELGATLASGTHRYPSVQDAVAAVLGDPSATVSTPVTAARSVPPPGRGRVDVQPDGGLPVTVDYDAALIADPAPVAAVAEMVALALQRDHLTAELLAGREQLVQSRARILQAADTERRRIVTDLHDGLQARLVLAALRVGVLAARPAHDAERGVAEEVRNELDAVLDELRRLVHGLMPQVLIDAGLFAAAQDLLARLPVPATLDLDDGGHAAPLPDDVASTAYFVLAEATTNAVRHAHATHLRVSLHREADRLLLEVADDGRGGAGTTGRAAPGAGSGLGLGLRSMTDRAEALGGRLVVESAAGHGTTVRAELPVGGAPLGGQTCAS